VEENISQTSQRARPALTLKALALIQLHAQAAAAPEPAVRQAVRQTYAGWPATHLLLLCGERSS
jgi:hypothetical protein